ncbi:hypothetical protein P8452_59692 [Trifolium repens]|nr:hypothetical protein P8452_59692 [Trifolium repens]
MKLSLYKKVQEKKSYKIERIGELPAKRKNNFREVEVRTAHGSFEEWRHILGSTYSMPVEENSATFATHTFLAFDTSSQHTQLYQYRMLALYWQVAVVPHAVVDSSWCCLLSCLQRRRRSGEVQCLIPVKLSPAVCRLAHDIPLLLPLFTYNHIINIEVKHRVHGGYDIQCGLYWSQFCLIEGKVEPHLEIKNLGEHSDDIPRTVSLAQINELLGNVLFPPGLC